MVGRATALGLLLTLGGCTNFPVIEGGECGNAVLEPLNHEDCDTYVDEEDEKYAGSQCRKPGDKEECRFDCATQSDGTRPSCPTDMGCDSDGVCRRPTGTFEPKRSLAPDASSWLTLADFDGDKRPELVSSEPADELQLARFRLHYFDNDANLVETRTFPRFTTRPIARKVTSDEHDDLVFSNGRVGVVPGRSDREWVPAAFSSYVVPDAGLRIAGVHEDGIRGGLPIASLTTINGVSGIYVPNFTTRRLELRAKLPSTVENLAGDLLVADLVSGPESPCSELVLAFRGETRLFLFDLCEPVSDAGQPDVDWRDTAIEWTIELPATLPVETGPLSADLDGDGLLDLVFGSGISGPGIAPHVMYGNGLGQLTEPRPLQTPPASMEPIPPPVMPIAMGDFTADGIADFVMPQELLVSRKASDGSSFGYLRSSSNRGAPWTMAQIADLNGNGFLDVVTASAGETGFIFHNGTGGPYVIGARIATARPLRFLSAGDFDGDLISDLAMLEAGPASAGKDLLSIAFGARDGLPLPPTRVTELAGVEQLGDCSIGSMDELFMATTRYGEQTESRFTLFDGSPDRLPFATYTLVTFSVDSGIQDYVAASLAFGSFSRREGRDVVVVGTDLFNPEWSPWLLPNLDGLVDPPRLLAWDPPPSRSVSPLREHGTQNALSVASAAADLDGDGLDEALWLMPEAGGGCALLAYDIDADAGSAVEVGRLHFDTDCLEPELGVADLDGDQRPDVLALIGNVAAGQASRIEVFWNDGSGALAQSRRTSLLDPQGGVLRAFSALGPSLALAYVTDSGLFIVRLDKNTRSFGEPEQLAELQNATGVVVFDPNGDAQQDIVVADETGLSLLRARLE